MEENQHPHLPPLTELVSQITFDIFGLSSAYLGLKLRGLHYGVEEGKTDIIGLTLCYALQLRGSERVFIVESSLIPETISLDEPAARLEWSWENLLNLRECAFQIQQSEPRTWLDEETLESQYQDAMRAIRSLRWAALAPQSVQTPLAALEMTRDAGMILGRKFDGRNMLLVGSLGLRAEQFVEAVKLLVPLQGSPEIVHRHQEEFELLTQEL